MPIYEYRCVKGHKFEAFQSMSEDSFTKCVECGAACERVLSAPSIHFKGSGFYTTDYARKGKKTGASEDSKSSDSSSSSENSSGDSKSKSTEKSSSEKSSSPSNSNSE